MSRRNLLAGAAALAAASGSAARASEGSLPTPAASDDRFCEWVQQQVAGTGMRPEANVVYDNEPDFRKSKTQVRPLTTHQFVLRSEDGRGTPLRVSCKVKTPDHLNAEYGPGTASAGEVSCRDLNRMVAAKLYDELDEAGALRYPQSSLIFDDDITTFMGAKWIGAFDHVYRDGDGRLHLQAKVLRVDWDDKVFAWAPEAFRGAWYCHMTAPEYLRELVRGDVEPPRP